jgi:hypothetical protein
LQQLDASTWNEVELQGLATQALQCSALATVPLQRDPHSMPHFQDSWFCASQTWIFLPRLHQWTMQMSKSSSSRGLSKIHSSQHSKNQCFSNPPTGMTVKHMTVRDDYSLPYHHLNTKTEDSLQEHNPER